MTHQSRWRTNDFGIIAMVFISYRLDVVENEHIDQSHFHGIRMEWILYEKHWQLIQDMKTWFEREKKLNDKQNDRWSLIKYTITYNQLQVTLLKLELVFTIVRDILTVQPTPKKDYSIWSNSYILINKSLRTVKWLL